MQFAEKIRFSGYTVEKETGELQSIGILLPGAEEFVGVATARHNKQYGIIERYNDDVIGENILEVIEDAGWKVVPQPEHGLTNILPEVVAAFTETRIPIERNEK